MTDKSKEENDENFLVGVSLLSDGTAEHASNLGALLVLQENLHMPVTHLRQLIKDHIPSCPSSFKFCSPQRWSISNSQESHLKIKNLISAERCIYIQKLYEKPKIGIKARTGTPLGFIFAETKQTLAALRQQINLELSFFAGIPDEYQFLDSNGWPISKHLEKSIFVAEVLVGNCVVVCADIFSSSWGSMDEVDGRLLADSGEPPKKRLKGQRQLSFRTNKDIERHWSEDPTDNLLTMPPWSYSAITCPNNHHTNDSKKQLLISYVRAEAADYALCLKDKLSHHGYSVYLDVHEIQLGIDWQDSLNFAVSNCEVFIPLVTSRYGETLWTNREKYMQQELDTKSVQLAPSMSMKVKLADVLGKYILPVNFLPDWPPRCLAIQFATTQYVSCGQQRLQTAMKESACTDATSQPANWNMDDVDATASEISQRLKSLSKTGAVLISVPSLARMKTLRKTFVGKLPELKSISSSTDDDIPPCDNKYLIVICLHPAQTTFGHDLRSWLMEKSYNVWLSCDSDFPTEESDTLLLSQNQESQSEPAGITSLGDYSQRFQSTADRAAIVLVVLSKDFASSQTCKQQMFYCEHRKPIIPVQFEEFSMPGWLSMLIGTNWSEVVDQKNYKQMLNGRLQRLLSPAARESLQQSSNEVQLSHAVEHIKKTVPIANCIYIAGSTRFVNPEIESVCRAIGVHLAHLDICLATGGFYGVGEIVSRAFYEEVQRLWKRQDVWHILPDRDPKDWTKDANQNPDGTFAVIPFGKTLFCGDSVRQRESIVSRCFDICVLVEGGSESADEADEFAWNDHIVVPVQTCREAAEKYSLPDKAFKIPQGVSLQDWHALTSEKVSSDAMGQCVARVVSGILHHLSDSKLQETDDAANTTSAPNSAKHSPRTKTTSNTASPKTSPKSPLRPKPSLSNMKTVILGYGKHFSST